MPARSMRRPASEDFRRGSSESGSKEHIKETSRENHNTISTNLVSQKPQTRRAPMIDHFWRPKIPDNFSVR